MSLFKVEKNKISKIYNHPNADRLDIANIEGKTYQFICQKGTQFIGNLVCYFPIDSILSQELIEHFGIGNMMAGKDKNRIKTVKLRGEISQGFVVNALVVCEFLKKKNLEFTPETLPDDLTLLLGVEKYEPPAIISKNANLIPLNGKIEVYDIEGSQNFPDIINYMLDKKVMISEKIEGMNGGFSIFSNGDIAVNQRNFFIEKKEGEEHTFWNIVKKLNLEEIIRKIQNNMFSGKSITFRFEVIGPGIQSNIYLLKEHVIKLFDIKVDEKYLDVEEFINICNTYNLPTVPILATDVFLRDWLNGKTFEEASNGQSVLSPIKREGIVCKLMKEEIIKKYGRSIIKNRSTEYLAKSEF